MILVLLAVVAVVFAADCNVLGELCFCAQTSCSSGSTFQHGIVTAVAAAPGGGSCAGNTCNVGNNEVCCTGLPPYGTAGTSGTGGTFGTAGTAGTSSTAGSLGTEGTAGTAGSFGTAGTHGTGGTFGTQGTAGTSGTAGSFGTEGTAGTAGSFGTAGTHGTGGTFGTQGTAGTSGTAGSFGTAGTSGTSGTGGLAGTAGTHGTGGTFGTQGTAGTHGTAGTFGTAGSSGTSGTGGLAGTAGTHGTGGTFGTQGTAGTHGTAGTFGTPGTAGTPGSRGFRGFRGFSGTAATAGTAGSRGRPGFRGTSGVAGTAGSAGSRGAAGACLGTQTVVLSTNVEIVDNSVSQPVVVTVSISGSTPGQSVVVKVTIDAGALPALAGAPAVTPGSVTAVVDGLRSLRFTVPAGVTSFSFSLASAPAQSGFADITAFLEDQAQNDCATDSTVVLVGPDILLGACACSSKGSFLLTPAGCSGVCTTRKRNNVNDLAKRAANVPGVVAQADFSVTYRRTTVESSSSHSVSRCGPRVLFLVANKIVYTNDATVLFGDQGVVSGSIEFQVPSTLLDYEIRLSKGKHCSGFDLQIWDPRFEVRTIGLVPAGVDPSSPKEVLKN